MSSKAAKVSMVIDDGCDSTSPIRHGREYNSMSASDQSPTTVHLEYPPTNKSVFAFLKGTRITGSHVLHHDPCIASKTSQRITAHAMDLPVLTRTKARSSVKYKPSRLSLVHGKRAGSKTCNPSGDVANIRECDTSVGIIGAMGTTAGGPMLLPPSSSSCPTTLWRDPSLLPAPLTGRTMLRTKTLSRPSCGSSIAPTLLRLDIHAPRSSSVMGLYGSARSSPNGSLADAASAQAVYCHSLKSTMSCTTQTESTLGLDNQDLDLREIVLTTTEMK
ncbi:MAG: hypothetical protein J3Q66DRAFT_79518 [Benniella sp.]|nr:MAG: hypothetical protein J3Q66DRAFT_79518 [Benniella sp.]